MLASARMLTVRDEGAGPPVVLLHGQPGQGSFWDPVVECLRRLGPARVLVPDRPGYGASDEPATGIAQNADAVVDLLDRLGLASATIVGHSWAGGVALALAERRPTRVDGLVLVGSIGTRSSIDFYDRLLARPIVGPALTFLGFRLLARLLPHPLVHGRVPDLATLSTQTVTDLVRSWGDGREWRSFLTEQRAMVREIDALDAGLDRIHAPAVVIDGAADRIVSSRAGVELADRIPSARFVPVAHAGHLLPQEDPQAVAEAIAGLLPGGG